MELPAVSRGRALVFGAAAVSLLALGGQLLLRDGGGGPAAAGTQSAALVAEPAPPPALLVVHVAGAVRHPGLYRLREGSRVDDALRAAGGPLAKAATDLVNLAAQVADGQQVVVPRRDALGAAGTASAGDGTGATAGSPPAPVHLNTATLEELDTLPGVGPATAQKIVDYREQNGGFRSVDELDAVVGIGPARLAELRPLVAP